MVQDKIQFGSVISATVEMSNEVQEDRLFDIKGNVRFDGDKVQAIEQGTVKDKASQELLADFMSSYDTYLSINFHTADNRDDIYDALTTFINDVNLAGTERVATVLSLGK